MQPSKILPWLVALLCVGFVSTGFVKEQINKKVEGIKAQTSQDIDKSLTANLIQLKNTFCALTEEQKPNAQLLTVKNETDSAIFIPYCEPKAEVTEPKK